MSGAVRTPAGDHRGILHADRASLVSAALPLISRALGDGGGVAVVVDRATARELEDALPHPEVGRVSFPAPSVLAGHGSRRFTATLARWAASASPGRVFVLAHYAPGIDLGPSLAGLPITLLCACAHDADPDVLAAFHDQHDVVVSAHDGPRTVVTLETAVGGTGDLAGIRRAVRRAAIGAGFRGRRLDRTVLAVHEACALACRLLLPRHDDDPAPSGRLELRTVDGRLDADVVVPTSRCDPDPYPGENRREDHEPDADAALGYVRPFCRAASVHEGARGRSIRVRALAGD